jgi:pimeloyl-ACP methyl ester carboxylesterase
MKPRATLRRGAPVLLGVLVLAFTLMMWPYDQHPADSSSAAARRSPAPSMTAAARELTWGSCTEQVPGLQCATLPVPIDWSRPDGATIGLRIARLPAAGPASGAASILVIPGGPGAGIQEVLAFAEPTHLTQWRQQHDIYLFDPRGIGESHPVHCTQPDPFPPGIVTSQAELSRWSHRNRAFAESCLKGTGPLMRHLSSADTARDIDAIRRAIGQDAGLVAYSGSYGTSYAAAYLDLGGQAQSLILDGVVDHSVSLSQFAERVAMAEEDAFGRFTQWCNATTTCALHGQDAGAIFDQLVTSAPLPAPRASRPATALEVRARIGAILAGGRTFGWPKAAQLLAQARDGDASAFVVEPQGTGLFQGVICSDYSATGDFRRLSRPVDQLSRIAPRFGPWKYWDVVAGCLGYPAPTDRPHPLHVEQAANVLVGSNTHDPATPLINALSVWRQLPGADLLEADTDGHQGLVMSSCAADAYLGFLDDPSSLPPLTECPA